MFLNLETSLLLNKIMKWFMMTTNYYF